MTEDLLERKEGRVAILTMNRPDRLNAMSGAMLDAMIEALSRLATDPDTGCVILTGAGRGFCAGGDVKSMAEGTEFPDAGMEGKAQQLRAKMESSRMLHEMPKPTIAMVRGPAAGAGLSLALACDIRVASDTTRMTTAFANVGYSGDFGGSYFLTRLVGTAKARELYYTADKVEAAEALALGMVNKVVADDQLEVETMALANKMANGPAIALGYMKRNMNAAETGSLSDCFDLEAMHHTRTGMTDDHKEAAQAFVDKRTPVFKGQ
ncbi:MAG: enoyl-CoA hydratase [Rhodospirillaceae bacterium]|jgi:2-(1,2-epoxy-1,2-dihydrophenyl)acetyl-CoA isomerase|nr:enoyl-CoA hydratase [Rhodospirillaceae bacterium]MBT4045968.1 enoyl-CoA hydratase [Rhodospirillaceae bacterium]MBT4686741.1 enoyl-CoA hydratase [Rhodospirillaceae bacterium]MBT5082472.1 enoyl-CoA hydratase [Rhodospirillaceae bacterium]MBT5523991.1 enoyl-CoA hydratase [Rhodospirillaceae bacterium]